MSRPPRSRDGARLLMVRSYSFSEKFKLSAGHFSSMLLTVFITMLQLAFFYLVPYFLMLAFGHHEVGFFSVMAASAFVQLLSSAVPLPGGTGGARGRLCIVLGSFLWVGFDRRLSAVAPHYVYCADHLAAPLLGLKSAHNESIHARWDRVMRKFGRTPQTPSAPTKPHPTNAVTVPIPRGTLRRPLGPLSRLIKPMCARQATVSAYLRRHSIRRSTLSRSRASCVLHDAEHICAVWG